MKSLSKKMAEAGFGRTRTWRSLPEEDGPLLRDKDFVKWLKSPIGTAFEYERGLPEDIGEVPPE